jgi:probable toxin-antitoxin system toxin component, PIN family
VIKVVLDTNVLVSGLLWEGIPNRLLTLIKQGKVTLHLSLEIVEELEAVLKRNKFSGRIQELETNVDELLFSLLVLAEIYSVGSAVDMIKEDPDDNMFLTCALYSGAEYIVSGDKHLLGLGSYRGVKILSPKEFLDKVAPVEC